MRQRKIIVCGLGQIGFTTAKYLTQFRQFDVYGFDISPKAVDHSLQYGIKSTSLWEKLPFADTYIICVSTNMNGEHPDMESVYDVGEKIKRHLNLNGNSLVSVESTILPGTCRRLYKDLDAAVNLVHVPHRYWSRDPIRYGVKQRRILGAINQASQSEGVAFYSSIEVPLHVVSKIEIAEMGKIVENTYRFVEIAFAEELNIACNRLGLDFEELREACNTLVRESHAEDWRVQILKAEDGIGGHCLPKDIRFLLSMSSDSKLLRAALATDQSYRLAKRLVDAIVERTQS
jgi:nucleotide sugar dehydrogenase